MDEAYSGTCLLLRFSMFLHTCVIFHAYVILLTLQYIQCNQLGALNPRYMHEDYSS